MYVCVCVYVCVYVCVCVFGSISGFFLLSLLLIFFVLFLSGLTKDPGYSVRFLSEILFIQRNI